MGLSAAVAGVPSRKIIADVNLPPVAEFSDYWAGARTVKNELFTLKSGARSKKKSQNVPF